MPFRRFIIPAYIGSFLWGFCFITLGKVLGPRWELFHRAASKYFIIFIIVIVILLAGYLTYRFYKNQIKDFFIRFISRLLSHLKTIRKTEIFLIILTLILIGMVTLMLGMAQDYLNGEFGEFDEVAEYLVEAAINMSWMKIFILFQSPYALGAIIGITVINIWRKGKNRLLEYLLLIVSILGARLFHESIMQILSYLQSIGFVGKFHSDNFPDIHSTIIIIIYGTCLFLLVRHPKTTITPVLGPIFTLILLIGLTIAKVLTTDILPSDIVGGYVYGGVWIFFNFLMFEMIRLVVEKN